MGKKRLADPKPLERHWFVWIGDPYLKCEAGDFIHVTGSLDSIFAHGEFEQCQNPDDHVYLIVTDGANYRQAVPACQNYPEVTLALNDRFFDGTDLATQHLLSLFHTLALEGKL